LTRVLYFLTRAMIPVAVRRFDEIPFPVCSEAGLRAEPLASGAGESLG